MHPLRINKTVLFLAAVSLVALTGLLCSNGSAQEKSEPLPKGTPIRVTGGASKNTTPKADTPERLPGDGMFDFLHKQTSGAGDVDVPLSQPSKSRNVNRQLQDLFDREKNWIFLTPQNFSNNTLNQEKTPEEMFNLDSEPGGNSRKTSKVFESFWNENNSKPATKPAAAALGDPIASAAQRDEKLFGKAATMLDPRGTMDARGSGAKVEPVNWNQLFGQSDKPDSASSVSRELYGTTPIPSGNFPSALSTSASLPEFSSKAKPAADEFSKLFKNPSTKSLTALPNDPINSALDASEQDLNPVVGRRLNEVGKGIKPLEALPSARGNNLPLASFTPGSLGDLNAKIAEQESQRPAFAPQPEVKVLKGKPAVLEFPKRNF